MDSTTVLERSDGEVAMVVDPQRDIDRVLALATRTPMNNWAG